MLQFLAEQNCSNILFIVILAIECLCCAWTYFLPQIDIACTGKLFSTEVIAEQREMMRFLLENTMHYPVLQ